MRDDKISIAKAIGILLMVAGHAGIPDVFSHFIAMFHMPLFFFMAGYCFKERYLSASPVTFIGKRVRGLYVPYVKWSLLFLLFHNIFFRLNIYNDEYGFRGEVSQLYSWKEFVVRGIKIVVGLHGNEQLLGGYWFLPQLLYASIIGFLVIKYIKFNWRGLLLVFAVAILASLLNLRVPFWGIRSLTFLSATFFLAGYVYKKHGCNWNKWHLTTLFAIIVAHGSVFFYTSMLSFTTDKILPYTICAICGTIMTLNISAAISACGTRLKTLLLWAGGNTLDILTWHFICFKLVSLVIIGIYGLPIEMLACFPVIPGYTMWWVLYFVIGAGVPLAVKYLIYKFKSQKG